MTKHGDSIRTLAESPLVGPRFKDFISRWEMNIEPPPVEKADRYVCTYPISTPVNADTTSRTAPSTPQRWGQGKLPDTLEEDYFNSYDTGADADDEEDYGRILRRTIYTSDADFYASYEQSLQFTAY